MDYVTVSLLQSGQSILTTFSGSLQQRALANFKATGVDVRLQVRVTRVTRDTIELSQDGKTEELPYGICVWSTGALPLVVCAI
jgi:NADH dehydrogenase FAD-containing subunit